MRKTISMQKLLVTLLALTMLMSSMTVAFGAVTLGEEEGKGEGNVDIIGTVEPITRLQVAVPLSVNFVIKEDRTIEWAEAEITSNCPAPLDVVILNTNAAALTQDEIDNGYVDAPNLVADDAFEDWDNLTRAQTKSNIAISMNGFNLSVENQLIGDLDSAFGAEVGSEPTLSLVGSANYGKAWANTTNQYFKYNMILEFGMK